MNANSNDLNQNRKFTLIESIPAGFYSKNYYWTDQGYGIFLDREMKKLRRNADQAANNLTRAIDVNDNFLKNNNLDTMIGDPTTLSLGTTLKKRKNAGLDRWWDFGLEELNTLRDQYDQTVIDTQNAYNNWVNSVNKYHNALNSPNATHRPVFQILDNGKMFLFGKSARPYRYRDIHKSMPFPQINHNWADEHPDLYVSPDDMTPSDGEIYPSEHNSFNQDLSIYTDDKLRKIANELVHEGFTTKNSIYFGEDSVYNTIDSWEGGTPEIKRKLKDYVLEEYYNSAHAINDVRKGLLPFSTLIVKGRDKTLTDTLDILKTGVLGEDGLTWDDALTLLPYSTVKNFKNIKAVLNVSDYINKLRRADQIAKVARQLQNIKGIGRVTNLAKTSKIFKPFRYMSYSVGDANRRLGSTLGTFAQKGLNAIGLSKYGRYLPQTLKNYGGINLALDGYFGAQAIDQIADGNWSIVPWLLVRPMASGVKNLWKTNKALGAIGITGALGALSAYPIQTFNYYQNLANFQPQIPQKLKWKDVYEAYRPSKWEDLGPKSQEFRAFIEDHPVQYNFNDRYINGFVSPEYFGKYNGFFINKASYGVDNLPKLNGLPKLNFKFNSSPSGFYLPQLW